MPFDARRVLLFARITLLPELLNISNKRIHARSSLAVLPFSAIAYAPHLLVQPDGAAYGRVHVGAVLDALPQHADAPGAVVLTDAVVQLIEVDAVLKRAVRHELPLRDARVLPRQAHGEAEVDFRVRVQRGGAQLDDVAQALRLAVLAFDAVVVVCRLADVGQLEVDFVGDALHGGEDKVLKGIWS